MAIPLEDSVEDILGKAQRGLDLDDETLARKLSISAYELSVAKDVRHASREAVEQLAAALELDAGSLRALAEGAYAPVVRAPEPGFFMASTNYGDMMVNAYLVWDKETLLAAAFDTGGDAMPLVEEIQRRRLKLQDVYLTHTHVDHVGELDRLCEKVGGSIGVHVPEPEKLEGAVPFKPSVTFSLGRLQIESRNTSGHSEGGTTYHIHGLDTPLAIVGDALFAGSVGGIRSGYHAALKRIRDHILSGQDNTVLAPGHGPLTTVKQEKEHNPFFPEFHQTVAAGI
jgi:glyoxylase-like metal-dependent hydrolase (beta-lactamase superfamily II)